MKDSMIPFRASLSFKMFELFICRIVYLIFSELGKLWVTLESETEKKAWLMYSHHTPTIP
jgi:hypothetical protein